MFFVIFRLICDRVANHKTTRYVGAKKKVIYNQYKNNLREILRRLCEYNSVPWGAHGNYMHMLVLILPK